MPILQTGESSGRMANGMTYMVRPAMQPVNIPRIFCFISPGSAQLLVGPASSLVFEQIYVRSSTRATSLGCERARKHPGRFCWLSLVNVPLSTIRSHSAVYSCSEPSHQNTRAGLHSLTISSTHASSAGWSVLRSPKDSVVIVIIFALVASIQSHFRRAWNYALLNQMVKPKVLKTDMS